MGVALQHNLEGIGELAIVALAFEVAAVVVAVVVVADSWGLVAGSTWAVVEIAAVVAVVAEVREVEMAVACWVQEVRTWQVERVEDNSLEALTPKIMGKCKKDEQNKHLLLFIELNYVGRGERMNARVCGQRSMMANKAEIRRNLGG